MLIPWGWAIIDAALYIEWETYSNNTSYVLHNM
jgi:hypothetical protein